MNKRILYALILLGIVIIILLFNSDDSTRINLIFTDVKMMSSMIFLGFTAIGVAIGSLIK